MTELEVTMPFGADANASKYCPQCRERRKEYETICPECGSLLVSLPAEMVPLPNASLVPVFGATDMILIPLVGAALETAGIEYAVRDRGISHIIIGTPTSTDMGKTDAPIQILVRSEDQARADEVLRALETPEAPLDLAERSAAPAAAAPGSDEPVDLFDVETGTPLGRITSNQLDSLDDHLERESDEDDDYYIDEATLAMLEERQVDPTVVALLRRALGSRSGMDVRWLKR